MFNMSDENLKLYEIENKIRNQDIYRDYHEDLNGTLDIAYMQYCKLKRSVENPKKRKVMRNECIERIETLGRELLVLVQLLKQEGIKDE